MKVLPHSAHSYGRSPLWMRSCCSRLEVRVKALLTCHTHTAPGLGGGTGARTRGQAARNLTHLLLLMGASELLCHLPLVLQGQRGPPGKRPHYIGLRQAAPLGGSAGGGSDAGSSGICLPDG